MEQIKIAANNHQISLRLGVKTVKASEQKVAASGIIFWRLPTRRFRQEGRRRGLDVGFSVDQTE